MTGAVEAVEELLAGLQLERSGIAAQALEPAARRAGRLTAEIASLGLSGFVAELLDGRTPGPATDAVLDLEADEPGRRASYETWRAEAGARTGHMWQWLSERRHAYDGQPWWSGHSTLPLPLDSVRTLNDVVVPVTDLSATVRSWGRAAGLADATAEYNWRWLMLGKGLLHPGDALPELNDLMTGLVTQARSHGLLPPTHKVGVIRRSNSPSMVMPVRLPGFSLLSVPTAVTPVTVQYLQHEIAHLAEHALRPAAAPLAARWAFDPLRSEGWALLLEHLVTSPSWLRRLGYGAHTAARVARFLAEEERFSRGLMAVDLALETELRTCACESAALDAAAAVAARTGLQWAPELLLLRQAHLLNWRSYLAGYEWRDAVLAALTQQFGADWAECGEAWALLLRALADTGSAAHFLRTVRNPE